MFPELRQTLRQMRKSPGFTVTSVLILSLGIGATTAIFTLIQQVMMRSLPVVKPEQLWKIGDKNRCCNWGGYTQGDDGDFTLFSWEAYKQFRDNTPAFSDLAAFQAGNTQLGVRAKETGDQAETRNGDFVSGNFFQTFGVQAWMGRLLTPADDQEGAPPVAVMSYRTWLQHYGADRGVVGRSYLIDGHPFTVVGVAAPSFYGAVLEGWGMPDFWMPLTTEPLVDGATARLKHTNTNFLDLIGRVKPGTNTKALEAQLRGELHNWLASHVQDMRPQEKQTWQKSTLHLVPGAAGVDTLADDYGDGLRLLLAAAGCVLLVACANLANLLLARGLKNRQQTSIRVALGASRARLVRQALVESVTLGVLGGAAAIVVAYAGARLVVHLAFQIGGPGNWVPINITPSWAVLGFALAISVLTGMLFGIAPAWMTSHADPVEALRGSRGSTGTKARWPQKALVIAQAAMSLVLLSAAAMLAQSLRNLQNQNFGFVSQDRYVVWTNTQLTGYPVDQMPLLFRRINERLAAIPGVRSAAAATYAPMTGDSWNDSVRIEGQPEPPPKQDTSSGWTRVTPGYFETLGNSILQGRPITDEDTATTQHVAVINEAFAKKFFKGKDPIGRHFGPTAMKYAGRYTVIGVASDMRYMVYDLDKPITPMFYLPESQTGHFDEAAANSGEAWSHYLYNIVLWAPGHPANLMAQVKKALADIDPSLVVQGVDKYDDVLAGDFQQQDMIATLTLLFGGLGLVLAAVGLYGVTAYTVEQRTSEIGVRMALGADRRSVVQMVLKGAFLQVALGLALGIPAAILAGHAMAAQLFDVRPWNPAILAVATLALGLAAFLAAVIPARKAAGLDPVEALRAE